MFTSIAHAIEDNYHSVPHVHPPSCISLPYIFSQSSCIGIFSRIGPPTIYGIKLYQYQSFIGISADISSISYSAVSDANVELYIVGDDEVSCSTWLDAVLCSQQLCKR